MYDKDDQMLDSEKVLRMTMHDHVPPQLNLSSDPSCKFVLMMKYGGRLTRGVELCHFQQHASQSELSLFFGLVVVVLVITSCSAEH